MTTCADLIDETRRYLFAGQREQMNALSASIVAGDTTLSFTYDLNTIQPGAYLAIGLEIMYVWSVNTTAKTAVVQRAMLGSTAASHASADLVYVNSKFPAFSIAQALNADLRDLCAPSNGLYQTKNIDLTYNPAIQGYDLTGATDVIDILRVRAKTVGPSKIWQELYRWRIERNASTTDFADGLAIFLFEGGWPGRTIRITYSAPFTEFSALTDTTSAAGLAASMNDIPPLGAAMRLAGVREVQRNFNESQGDTRRAQEVPPNAQIAGMRALAQLREERIRNEAGKLASSWPDRRKVL